MWVKCVKAFRDLVDNVLREAEEEFEVTAKRYAEINSTRYGKLVEEVKKAEETKAPRTKRTTKPKPEED